MNTGALIGSVIAIIVIAGLVAVGVVSIRRGSQALAHARTTHAAPVVWHRQLAIMFGLNNIIFAALVAAVTVLLLATARVVKYGAVALVALLLIVSIILVIRCVMVALQASRDAVVEQQRKRNSNSSPNVP